MRYKAPRNLCVSACYQQFKRRVFSWLEALIVRVLFEQIVRRQPHARGVPQERQDFNGTYRQRPDDHGRAAEAAEHAGNDEPRAGSAHLEPRSPAPPPAAQ